VLSHWGEDVRLLFTDYDEWLALPPGATLQQIRSRQDHPVIHLETHAVFHCGLTASANESAAWRAAAAAPPAAAAEAQGSGPAGAAAAAAAAAARGAAAALRLLRGYSLRAGPSNAKAEPLGQVKALVDPNLADQARAAPTTCRARGVRAAAGPGGSSGRPALRGRRMFATVALAWALRQPIRPPKACTLPHLIPTARRPLPTARAAGTPQPHGPAAANPPPTAAGRRTQVFIHTARTFDPRGPVRLAMGEGFIAEVHNVFSHRRGTRVGRGRRSQARARWARAPLTGAARVGHGRASARSASAPAAGRARARSALEARLCGPWGLWLWGFDWGLRALATRPHRAAPRRLAAGADAVADDAWHWAAAPAAAALEERAAGLEAAGAAAAAAGGGASAAVAPPGVAEAEASQAHAPLRLRLRSMLSLPERRRPRAWG
jgi:hypothetical protein